MWAASFASRRAVSDMIAIGGSRYQHLPGLPINRGDTESLIPHSNRNPDGDPTEEVMQGSARELS